MEIYGMKTNHLVEPMGFNLTPLSLSYKVRSAKGARQTAAQIGIFTADGVEVYDSGMRKDIDSLSFSPDVTLKPRTRYIWNVRVLSDAGEETLSPNATFETGKMGEQWTGAWISADERVQNACLFKDFSLPEDTVSARLYISGLGLYEAEINGKRVGDECLAPGCNDYNSWIQYQTYDVTELLKKDNRLSVMLGDGWYKGRFGFQGQKALYGDTQALICEMRAQMRDGREVVVASNESWSSKESPVRFANIYDGEIYDASFAAPEIFGTRHAEIGIDRLTERLSPPVKIMQTMRPAALLKTPRDEWVIDMGQIMTGYLSFRTRGEKGHTYHLQYGETLQDDCFYTENLRSAKEEYTYICGESEAWTRPLFTFYGFRYVKLEGFDEITLDDFVGCVLYSDMERTGFVETSSDKVNRLALNALWGQMGNFLDVPTDCPQRDERMGWTGDAQAFCATACYQMDTAAFYTKYLYDMLMEQRTHDGAVPHVIPSFGMTGSPSCAWADAATVIPWTVYLFYGDRTLLSRQYENMSAWVDWLYNLDESLGGERLWNAGRHFADWLALDAATPDSRNGGTDPYFIASCYYLYSTRLTAKAARVLKKPDDERYGRLADEILSAIRKNYVTQSGRLALTTQTAYVLALFLGIVNEKEAPLARASLDKALEESGGALRTGFVGTAYLCRVLTMNGMNPWAYSLFLREEYPSWLYEVNMGATTVWERWNSILPDGHISDTGMNSLNHYAYGAVMEWLYRDAAGIAPVEDAPGFRRVRMSPHPDARLPKVSFRFESPVGEYLSAWEIKDDREMKWLVRVPFGGEAILRLPACQAEGVIFETEGAWSVARVTAGEYEIHCRFEHAPWEPLLLDQPLDALKTDARTRDILASRAPDLFHTADGDASFRRHRSNPFFDLPPTQFKAVESALNQMCFDTKE